VRGVDWILINGVNVLPKEDKQKFKEKYDMISMNKFIGTRMFLPLAVLCSFIVPLIIFEFEWLQAQQVLFGILIFILSFGLLVHLVRVMLKILDFDKWKK